MSGRKLSRRALLKLAVAAASEVAVMGVGGWAYAFKVEPGWVEVMSLRLALPSLAPEFDDYRVVQISDIHMDRWMTRVRLAEIVGLINKQKPNLIAITGDFVNYVSDRLVGDMVACLSGLTPRDATVAVLGNHDYWTDPVIVRRIIHESGIINVGNSVYTLHRGGAMLHIAGVDDVWERQADLGRVLDLLPDAGASILLAHEPDFADASAETGRFDLQISGHSHGGQVIIPFRGPPALPWYAKKYPVGRYQVGEMIQYTNRGLGMVAPRVRFNCRPEITVFDLVSGM